MNPTKTSPRPLLLAVLASAVAHLSVQAQTDRVQLNLTGSWPGYLRGLATSVMAVNNRAYVALEWGLAIYDVSNPSSPVYIDGTVGSCPPSSPDHLEYTTSGTNLLIYDYSDIHTSHPAQHVYDALACTYLPRGRRSRLSV